MNRDNANRRYGLTTSMGLATLLAAVFLAAASLILSANLAYASTFLTTEDGFVFVENEDNCEIVNYSGTDTELTIPATLNGKPVVSFVIRATSSAAQPECAEVSSVDFSACAETLTSFMIYGTKVQSVDVSNVPKLKKIDVRDNYLTSLVIGSNTSLEQVQCNDNLLKSLDVTGATSLCKLDCYDNFLTDLDVSKCTNLYSLDCHNNNLTSLKVGANTYLYTLYCYGNSIGEDLTALCTNPLCGTYDQGVILPQNGNQYDGAGKSVTPDPGPAPSGEGVEGFVERLYYNVMGRTASAEEVTFQANAMGTYGAAQITYNFYNSEEFANKSATMTNAAIVENVYQTMLGRSADEGGLAMWTGYLNNGMSACALVAGFAESQEFANVCAGYGIGTGSADQLRSMLEARDRNHGVTAFASRMYTVVLSRDAEVAGLNVQCEALINGTPCYQIALNFFDGDEYANKTKSDSEIVADCYRAMMDREGSSSEIAAWTARMASEGLSRSAVVMGFCQSDEFEAICQSCGMTSGMR